MQNIFVDMSIKICIAQERRFFDFLGNSGEPVFCRWAVSVVSSVELGEQPLVSRLFSKHTRVVLSVLILTIRVTCNSFGVRPMKMCELDSPSSPAARPPPPQPTRCAWPPSFHPGLSQPILLLIVLVFAACPPQIQP